jgi:4-methylaminobutanoate oxidase (formaldehyde-forming)
VESATPGTAVEVDLFGEWVDAVVAREPLFDPAGDRVHGR